MKNLNALALAATGAALALVAGTATPSPAFVTFESGQVRPMAISPDGNRLFVCNTPDNTLEIFDISAGSTTITHAGSVPVGLEPVAVAARTNDEVWVVNHLSDSVSIVDVTDPSAPLVTRTLNVGDEPRDIVFAGTLFDHAYITAAHRGQNVPFDPEFTVEGVARADVWVFDSADLGSSFGGDPVDILHLFGDTTRPLAVSATGDRVYAGVFNSGNQTTTLGEGVVPNGGEGSGGLPDPATDVHGDPRPEVGLIVKWDGTKWTDELDRNWSASVMFDLPDYDVFAIDATQDPPVQVAGTPGRFAHVGTTLFNMAMRPTTNQLFVTNLEAFNEVRFEGPGVFADTTVRGHIVESRVTVVDTVAETVTPRHLNTHIDYVNDPFDPIGNEDNQKSLAFPLEMAFTADGSTLYVAAFGSSKVGIYDAAEVVAGTFTPDVADQVVLTGGGPSGLVLDEANGRLFVLTRFDNSVSVVNTAVGLEETHVSLHNPEPDSVVDGRRFLYDAAYTSARGDQACASCHTFGDMDHLAWDLGNPDDETLNNPAPFIIPALGIDEDFHPMKGPMTTQSLRGMDNHGPLHWRGDRTNGIDGASDDIQPNGGIYNERIAFGKFNGAFVGLIGRSEQLTTEEMGSFTDFMMEVMYPPNPVRNLDDSLDANQSSASSIYFSRTMDTVTTCNGCHVHDRNGNLGNTDHPGFFGTDGRSTFENETQMFKVAHLRNLYQKVGMFGMAAEPFLNPGDNGHKGDQVRGFGFLHDGSIDTVFRFFRATVFNAAGPTSGFQSNAERRDMESLMLAFDSNLRPIVGQQATLSSTSGGDADNRVDLLLDRADAGDCEVVVKGVLAGEMRGWRYDGAGSFTSDRSGDAAVADATLRGYASTPGQELTFTAVPPGEGTRIGIDRDLDGHLDRDELDNDGDPADPLVLPCDTTQAPFVYKKAGVLDKKGKLQVTADVTLAVPYAGTTISVDLVDSDGRILREGVAAADLVPSSSGNSWKYKAPKGTTGITRATVKVGKLPGAYRVSLKTSAGWAIGQADEDISTTDVELRVSTECFLGDATKVD